MNQLLYGVDIIDLVRQQNVTFVAQRDQPAIEHPVHRAGQGYAVVDHVGPSCFNAHDMGCLSFGPTPAIDKLHAR